MGLMNFCGKCSVCNATTLGCMEPKQCKWCERFSRVELVEPTPKILPLLPIQSMARSFLPRQKKAAKWQ